MLSKIKKLNQQSAGFAIAESGKLSKNEQQILALRALALVLILATLCSAGFAYWFAFGKWVWKERHSLTGAQLSFTWRTLQRCKQDTGWLEESLESTP